jgi:dTDP-4-amino-4,6-dideoxygalactose transaminase
MPPGTRHDADHGMSGLPLSPLLVPATLLDRSGPPVPSVLDNPQRIFLTAGRMALALGMKLHGLAPGHEVLLPAYSSGSMVAPIRLLGATPVFYRLTPDLDADLDDLATKAGPHTRALLAVNFFGKPQDWTALRRFADTRGLILIEDCAHALYGSWQGRPLGSFGDFAIASLTKFLPVWDGGLLAFNRAAPPMPETQPAPLRRQAKALFNLLEEAVAHGRDPLLRPLPALARLLRPRNPSGGAQPAEESLRRDVAGAIDPEHLMDAPTGISRLVATGAAQGRIARRRRANFARIAAGLTDLAGCRIPWSPGPDEVPYMVPVRIDDLARLYPHWVARRIPMQRYAEFLPQDAGGQCPVAEDFSRHLVQFPCHQDLDEAKITQLIDAVRTDLGGGL